MLLRIKANDHKSRAWQIDPENSGDYINISIFPHIYDPSLFSDHKLVGFSVYLKNRVENGQLISAVKFEHVITNTGNGYDVHTGLFTAPAAGLYSFSARMSSPKSSQWYIMWNGETVAYLFTTGSHEKWESCSESVSLKLTAGDKVWIDGKGTFEGYEPFHCNDRVCYHTSFTGLLVQPD